MNVDVYDPWADSEEVKEEYGIDLLSNEQKPTLKNYSAIILAVSHDKFRELNIESSEDCVVFDVKGFLNKNSVDKRL